MATASQVYLGIVLELAGKEISLEPKTAITEIKTKGMEVGLPPGQRIDLKTVQENLLTVLNAVDVDSRSFLDQQTGALLEEALPDIDALKNAVNLMLGARLGVEQFHVRVPPSYTLYPSGATVPTVPADSPPIITNPDGSKLVPISATITNPNKTQGAPPTIPNPLRETAYTIGLSAIWEGEAGTLFGNPQTGLKLKGLYFKASNEGG